MPANSKQAKEWVNYFSEQGITLFRAPVETQVIADPVSSQPENAHPEEVIVAQTTLPDIQALIGDCQRCRLSKTRTNIVFGEGDPQASLLFVGEGPGAEEDKTGRPFVGRAGKLLDKMILAMGYAREDVFIANIVKCRPPQNRDPEPDEIESCFPFLAKQIEAIAPQAIVTLGKPAARTLLGHEGPMSQIRGIWQKYQDVPVMPTYHPAYLLRTPSAKAATWSDLQLVMEHLGKEVEA